jgi:two-component system NtrC family sensor kinase
MNTVFIADDSNTDRLILESSLCKLGYEVTTFATGTAICEAIRSAGRPVVALLDWLMPDRNGVDICRELAADPPPVPIFTMIVTSRTDKNDIAFALDNGADDFIAKPYNLTELRARINVGIRLLTFKLQLIESNKRLLEYTRNVERLAEARAEQLVRADRLSTIGILSASIAHEINNPTSFVAVNVQTIEENIPILSEALGADASEAQQRRAGIFLAAIPEILTEMKNGVARIRNIVNGLKTYSRAAPEKHEWFSIELCIESALQLCANRLKYHVTVTTAFSPVPEVYGDKYQIEQVFVNLFTNAADAIEESGKDGALAIATSAADGKAVTTVHDTGPGIPPAVIDKIFTPFYTTKAIGKGTGLGLSISRNIIKDHKGELLVENHPDGGAQFIIHLPAK